MLMNLVPSLTPLLAGLLGVIVGSTETFEVPFEALGLTSVAALPLSGILRRKVGRPRKFDGPSRAVTLTLPESVIESLTSVDPDLSRAVVGLAAAKKPTQTSRPAQIEVFGRRGVISVRPTESLKRRAGLELIPLPDGRALMSFDGSTSIADVELVLKDALDDKSLEPADRDVFKGVAAILSDARRSSEVALLKRNVIVIENSGRQRKNSAKRRRRP